MNEGLGSYPVYYVVAEVDRQASYALNAYIYNILKVHVCDFADIERINIEEVAPLQAANRLPIETRIYHREPENPFREMAKEQDA